MKEVVDGKLMAVVVVLFFLAFLHGIFRGLGPRKGPAPLPTLDLSSVMESLKAELPGVLQAVLPSMLDEALTRGDALPQDGANLVVQAFREELPQALQKLLPELLPELLAEAKKETTTGDGDGGAPGLLPYAGDAEEHDGPVPGRKVDDHEAGAARGLRQSGADRLHCAAEEVPGQAQGGPAVSGSPGQTSGNADPTAYASGQDGTGPLSNAGWGSAFENRGRGDEYQVPALTS